MGLIRLFSNVKLLTANQTSPKVYNNSESFEDWWINPEFFPENILNFGGDSIYYHHCIRQLKEFNKIDYTGIHACSRAFPDEYFLHVLPGEREYMVGILDFIRSNNLQR